MIKILKKKTSKIRIFTVFNHDSFLSVLHIIFLFNFFY